MIFVVCMHLFIFFSVFSYFTCIGSSFEPRVVLLHHDLGALENSNHLSATRSAPPQITEPAVKYISRQAGMNSAALRVTAATWDGAAFEVSPVSVDEMSVSVSSSERLFAVLETSES